MASLRSWLRQQPQPARLRIVTPDDEERDIELSPNARNRWKGAEETITSSRARVVHCIDSKGSILRSQTLDAEDGDDDTTPEDREERRTDKAITRERRELAAVLDRYGDRLNEAFDRGSAAASSNQESMMTLVEVLTTHLSLAITNLHNVSVNLANAMSGTAVEPESKGQAALMQLAAAVMARGGLGGGGAPEATPKNGKGGK
jgi:hypothetical protein